VVTTTQAITVALVRAAAAFALSLSTAAPVAAADWSRAVISVPATYVGEFGMRFWFGQAQTKKGLFDTISNTDICFPSIPDSIRGVSQTNTWLRLGFEAAVEFDQRWKVTLDAAWLPYAALYGADTHLLRIGANPGDFTGPVPDDGKGWGYQFDAIVSYRFSDWVSVGVGGRYWHVEAKGHSHFEGHVVDFNAQSQVVHWRADHFGAFIQANIKFGPYRVSSN
jgi:hypothetical protein